jgi:diacylglycerol O-acyltransferase / wax synthase
MGERRTAAAERLTPTEASFVQREQPTVPQHLGTLALLDGSAGLDYDRLVALVEDRIGGVPVFRQRLRTVPGQLANPVWVDDSAFDITYHVRRSSLPRPGAEEQLLEFCARIQSRLLDRDRPLWEIYLVEGLADGRVALMTKTHQAVLAAGPGLDIAQLVLDSVRGRPAPVEAIWMPRPEPTGVDLVRAALTEAAVRPMVLLTPPRLGGQDVRAVAARVGSFGAGVVSAATTLVRRSAASPLAAEPGERRRIAIARTCLDDYRQVRSVHGGSVNDIMLAAVTGAVRGWLLFRDRSIPPGATMRALVPVGVVDEDDRVDTMSLGESEPETSGDPVVLELPIGEPDPVLRLARIGYAMDPSTRRSVGPDRLAVLGGFAPPPLHALGLRAGDRLTRRRFQFAVTCVPGAQRPQYAADAQLLETYPLPPLGSGRAAAIGVASYDGGVYYGINGDWDAMADAGVLAMLLTESLAELVTASPEPDRSTRGGRRLVGPILAAAAARGRS